jgi:hypothetical protein
MPRDRRCRRDEGYGTSSLTTFAVVQAIEVDESLVGEPEEGLRWRQTETKVLIIIAAQEDGTGIGRIRMRRAADASAADSLESMVKPFLPIATRTSLDRYRNQIAGRLVNQHSDWHGISRERTVGNRYVDPPQPNGTGRQTRVLNVAESAADRHAHGLLGGETGRSVRRRDRHCI